MSEPVARLRDVSLSYSTRFAVRHVDLEIEKGEAVAIMGSNGAGKTTLLKILATILNPSRGEVHLFGQPLETDRSAIRPRIGVLFTAGFLYGDLTAAENLQLYARLYRVPNRDRAIAGWLDRLGMTSFAREPVRNLSRGERQKIALIRTLIHEPELLLLDEPTSGLDGRSAEELKERLAGFRGSRTVVCVTHQPTFPEGWVDRTLRMEGGKLQ